MFLADDPEARVYGWAKCLFDAGKDPNIDLPMLTKVFFDLNTGGELWMGGAGVWPKPPHRLPDDFDFVLQLTKREFFDIGPNTSRRTVVMADTDRQGFEVVEPLAQEMASRIKRGQKVLIHCQVGMNRSGLLTAATLVRLGWPPDMAILIIRSLRGSMVLCNPSFEKYILEMKINA